MRNLKDEGIRTKDEGTDSYFVLRTSYLCCRRRRRGVSILEVLFAIMITSVGLLSAVSIFPVASAQARRARLNDMMASAGRSAFHHFDTSGMRRPDRLLAWDESPLLPPAQAFVPVLSVSNKQPAESFCIDPRMIAAHTTYQKNGAGVVAPLLMPGTNGNTMNPGLGGQCVQFFPYHEPFVDQNLNSIADSSDQYSSAGDLNGNGAPDPVTDPRVVQLMSPPAPLQPMRFDSTYMRRITLWDGVPPAMRPGGILKWPMSTLQANAAFTFDDDLSYERPEDDKSAPARQSAILQPPPSGQPWDPNKWLKRQADSKISWIATLVPKFDVSGLPSDQYVLSVVMIYERSDALDVLDDRKERVVNGLWQGTGVTGGEIILTSDKLDALKVRPNDWVMVSGSYPVNGSLITRFQWYRISDCEAEPIANTSTGLYALSATLIGQDWNPSYVYGNNAAGSGFVRVTIVEGAFAVYEKTVRLEYGSSF